MKQSLFSLSSSVHRAFVALALSVLLAGCAGRVELLSAIPEAEANEVIAALINQGIDASKVSGKEGMVGVRVLANQSARAVDVLRAMGLPRERFSGMGEIFRKDGLISSPVEERARYLYALSQDLSATLSRIDGVLFARVHLVLPERGSGAEAAMPASAAVFIKHKAESNLEALQPQVRRLVTNSIPGLTPDRVSTVLVPSAVSLPGRSSSPTSVLGVRVESDSITNLVILLVVCAFVAAAGAAGAVYWLLRRTGVIARGSRNNAPPTS